MDNLQLLGFSSAVRALSDPWRPSVDQAPVVFHAVQIVASVPSGAYCPGTEQGTREWHGYGQLEAERMTGAVSVMSRSSRGGRAPASVSAMPPAQRRALTMHTHAPRSPAYTCLLPQGWPRAPLHPPSSPLPLHCPSPQADLAGPALPRGWVMSPSRTAAPR